MGEKNKCLGFLKEKGECKNFGSFLNPNFVWSVSARKVFPCVPKHEVWKKSEFRLKRVLEWITDKNRKPSNLAFTAGTERKIAYWFEHYYSEYEDMKFHRDEWKRLYKELKKRKTSKLGTSKA